jgi:hypothetical protein
MKVIDTDDVGVVQTACRPAFILHKGHGTFGGRQLGMKQFYGDVDLQFEVVGPPDFSHAPPA